MKQWSLVHQLSALFASVAILVSLFTGWALMHAVDNHFADMDRHVLQHALTDATKMLQQLDGHLELDELPSMLHRALPGPTAMSLVLRDDNDHLWAVDRGLSPPSDVRVFWPNNEQLLTLETYGLRAMASRVHGKDREWSLLVLMDMQHHVHFMQEFRVSLWIGLMLSAILVGGLGYIISLRSLSPLSSLAHRMQAVSVQDMQSQQLPLPESVELRAVADAFNTMLTRFSGAFERLQDVSANMAHELRTPLNALMLQAQVTLSQPRSVSEYEDQLEASLEELSQLSRMVEDMLFLARSDNGLMALKCTTVDVDGLLRKICHFYLQMSEDRNLEVTLSGTARVYADEGLLRRALVNLLSNALTYAPVGSQINIELSVDHDGCSICFENEADLTDMQVSRLCDRFWRVDGVRGNSIHVGLGLAIVVSIAQLHEGNLTVAQQDGKLRVTLYLPLHNKCT